MLTLNKARYALLSGKKSSKRLRKDKEWSKYWPEKKKEIRKMWITTVIYECPFIGRGHQLSSDFGDGLNTQGYTF